MRNLNSLPVAVLIAQRISKVYDIDLSVMQISHAVNSISPIVLCVASAAILAVMEEGEAGPREIIRVRQSAPSYYLWPAVDSNPRADNRYESGGKKIRNSHLGVGTSEAVMAQSGYGPGSMDAPTAQPGNTSGPMGFPLPQPGYGPGSMDAPTGQPGYMPAPSGFPAEQPGSVLDPRGLPRTTPGYGTDTTGAPPVQVGPSLPSTANPPAQPNNGPGTTDSLGAKDERAHTVLRATNTARMRAEALNGGLRVYRTSSCMYQQSGGECLISINLDGYLFRFFGGEPGWQQLGKPPTLETEILIARDGKTVARLLYNGPPRSVSTPEKLPGAPQPATTIP